MPAPTALPTALVAGNTGHLANSNTVHGAVNGLSVIPASTHATAYTLVLADSGEMVEATSASAMNITAPANVFPAGTIVSVCQYGAGQVTIVAGSGLTLRTASSATTRAQYSEVALRYRSTTECVLSGDLT